MKMHRFLVGILIFGFLSFSAIANTPGSTVPVQFQGFDADSRLAIDYRDLDSLLNAVVLNTGRSDRKKASAPPSQTGTRMKISVNRATINEGNRFFFEVFQNNAENQETLRKIQNRLENIPSSTPLEKFSRDEQLAYWINLYNTTLLEKIVSVYPESELEELLVGENSILSKKVLMVAGVPLSLNDIQFTILKQNYENNPLVIYGLYQGIIGGPNIRKTAYTGKYVYADLIDNTIEFINSNRGTESRKRHVFRVSSLYERNQIFFPDFDRDLTAHLLTYLEGEERTDLKAAKTIKPDINDWTVPDLYGSGRNLGGSFATGSAALNGAITGSSSSNVATQSATSRYSPAVVQRLTELNQKRDQQQTGIVTVEELDPATYETDTKSKGDSGSK